jgi:hypothetical protein
LKNVKAALEEHDKALKAHAAAIRLHHQSLGKHEQALAEFEQGGTAEEPLTMAPEHQKEDARHGQQRNAHERIKKHHHTMIAQLNLVQKALSQAT